MPFKDLDEKKQYNKEWHKQNNKKRYTLAHVRGKKIFNIAKMTYQKPSLIKQEAAKCDVVCSNCHRQRTHDRLIMPL